MLLHANKTKAVFYLAAGIWFCSLFLFVPGCSYNNKDVRHSQYFDPFFSIVDTAPFSKKTEALALLDSAFRSFPNPTEADIFSYDSIKCDQLSFVRLDYIGASAYADSMLLLVGDRINNETNAERYSWALSAKGDCFRHMKRFEEALRDYKQAQNIVLNYVKNKCKLAKYDANIALLMFEQEKYLLAAPYFLKQYDDLKKECIKDDYRHLMDLEASLNNAALSYLEAGLLDSALHYETEAINIIEANENKFPEKHSNTIYAKSVIYGDQGQVLFKKGRYAEAEELFKKSIIGSESMDQPYSQIIQGRLANLYFANGNNKLLQKTMAGLKRSLDSLPHESVLLTWMDLKIKYFSNHMQIDSAFAYQLKYDAIKDSVNARNKKFASEDVGKVFENLELKYTNDLLVKESKLKNLYLVVSILILLMAATVAIFVWYNLRREKKLNHQVMQKNVELERSYASLEQSHAENANIMRVVAHDLRNPISAIQNIMHALMKNEQLESQREMFSVIQASCNNSMALIKELLEERKQMLKKTKEPIDINKLIENCVQLLQAKADEKKQKLKYYGMPAEINANRQKIWRVISNLINNAIKFSYNKSSIIIRVEKIGNGVCISVEDHGIGIPENLKKQIFELSQDKIRSGTEGEKSHGLGLSISKKIVEEHHGKLWFESEEGKGSVFYVELPDDTK